MKSAKTAVVSALFLALAAFFAYGTAQTREEAVRIGQIDFEKVFSQYSGTREFETEVEKIQSRFLQAQEEGDQQKLMEIQQEFEMKQNQLFMDFQSAVEKAAPMVSSSMDVQVIVAEVVHHTDRARLVDVSEAMIEQMN